MNVDKLVTIDSSSDDEYRIDPQGKRLPLTSVSVLVGNDSSTNRRAVATVLIEPFGISRIELSSARARALSAALLVAAELCDRQGT